MLEFKRVKKYYCSECGEELTKNIFKDMDYGNLCSSCYDNINSANIYYESILYYPKKCINNM